MATLTRLIDSPLTDFVDGALRQRLDSDEFRALLENQRSTRAALAELDEARANGEFVDSLTYHNAYDASRVAYGALSAYKDGTAALVADHFPEVAEADFNVPEDMKRLGEAEAGTIEWLRMRQPTLGGSDIGAICQVGSRGKSARESVRKMKTAQEIEPQTHGGASLRGDLWEPALMSILTQVMGQQVYTNKGTYAGGQRSVNLDGFMLDAANNVSDIGEAKTSAFPEDWTENWIPERYALQVQHYMDIFGLSVGHIIVNVDDERIMVYRMTSDHRVPASEDTPKSLGAEFSYSEVLPYALNTLGKWNDQREAGPKPSVRGTRKPNGLAESWGRVIAQGFVSVDLETTTFSPETGHIIELALVRDDGETLHRFYGLPEAHMMWNGTGAVDIHRITAEDVAGQPVLLGNEALLSEIREFIGNRVLIAHNASFERSWLREVGLRAEYADSMVAFAALVTDEAIADNTMRSLVEWAGGEYLDAHRALADAQMLYRVLPSLMPVVEAHIAQSANA